MYKRKYDIEEEENVQHEHKKTRCPNGNVCEINEAF